MAAAIPNIQKSNRGRPRTDATPVLVTMRPELLAALNLWIESQPAPAPSRPEAVRRLLAVALEPLQRPATAPE
jgi:hypothetical protein